MRYTEPLIVAAVRTFMWRRVGREFGWSGLAACAALLVFIGWDIASGDRSWTIGALVAVPLALIAVAAAVWIAHYNTSLGKLRAMKIAQSTWTLSQDAWTVVADSGSSTMPWSAITQVWELPDYWMLMLGKNQFVTLPTADVPTATLDYVRARTRKDSR